MVEAGLFAHWDDLLVRLAMKVIKSDAVTGLISPISLYQNGFEYQYMIGSSAGELSSPCGVFNLVF